MERSERQKLVDQEAVNAQTVQSVADRQAEIASQADALAKKRPEFGVVAAQERENRKVLMEMAREERRLATAIQLAEDPPRKIAASEREHRTELLEMARREGQLGQRLAAMAGDDPTIPVLSEQALRNRDLLLQLASRELGTATALGEEAGLQMDCGNDPQD